MNFGPNVIFFTMPLVTFCQKPHFQIPHRSHTVRHLRHLSTSNRKNFMKLDASSKFEMCLCFFFGSFFFGSVYVRKAGIIQNYHEFSWQQHAKDPIHAYKHSPWLSHNLKMFEYMSSWKKSSNSQCPCSKLPRHGLRTI